MVLKYWYYFTGIIVIALMYWYYNASTFNPTLNQRTEYMTKRMTVCLGTAITSVTINDGIFELLSLKLKASPDKSMIAVRAWIQEEISRYNRTLPGKLSQWVTFQVVLFLADNETREAYYDGLKCDENDSSTIVPNSEGQAGNDNPLKTKPDGSMGIDNKSDINEPVEAADSTNATDKPESVPQSDGATLSSKGDVLTTKELCQLIVDMQEDNKTSQQIADEFNTKNIRTNRTRTAWVPAGVDQFKSSHKSKLDVG